MGTDTGNPTVLAGIIQDSAGKPVPSCSVWVRRMPASALAKTLMVTDTARPEHAVKTDADGSYEFVGLPAGSYALVAIAQGEKLGAKQNVQLASADTVRASKGLVLSPLVKLLLEFDESWLGDTAVIAELGLRFAITSLIMPLNDVPAGTYRVTLSAHPTEVLDVTTLGEDETEEGSSSSFASSTSSSSVEGLVLKADGTGSLTDSRDGNIYSVVTLGGAVWFDSNARYAAIGTTCNANDPYAAKGCLAYGRFYTYDLAVAEACPTGWHVPTQLDWQALVLSAGGTTVAGTMLKSTSGWTTGNGLDSFNLNVLAAGSASSPVTGTEAYFWTSTSTDDGMAMAVNFSSGSSSVAFAAMNTTEGLNIRCVLNP